MNVLENTYSVTAILQDGSTIVLDPAVTDLGWQDSTDEVAQRASITLAQTKTSKGWLNSLLPLCTGIQITANGNAAFDGVVWEWEYESSNRQNITLSCYDRFIYAQNSKTFSYFPTGKSTKDVVSKICSDNGIECDYQWESATHDRIVYRGTTIADQIMDAIHKAELLLGKRAVVMFEGSKLVVRGEAYNTPVYVFTADANTESTTERMTMDGLVTQVAIYGAEDKEDRRKLESIVPGKTEYGTLQDVVLMTSSSTKAQADAEAQGILTENGEPDHAASATTADVPEIRKGWKVKMNAGSLIGYYIVKGVTHDATERKMTMELRKQG